MEIQTRNAETHCPQDVCMAVGAILCLWIAILHIHWPSLRFVPLADQLSYLVDTINERGILNTIAHSYSYNRTRVVSPGDSAAFRPLLFVVLALEKGLFGAKFSLWQATGIALHCIIAMQVFLLIRGLYVWIAQWQTAHCLAATDTGNAIPMRLHSAASFLFPWILTSFFALNVMASSMVTWAHIHGYMLFFVLVLGASQIMLRMHTTPVLSAEARRIHIILTWLLLFLAALTYEMGQVIALLWGAFLAVPKLARGQRRMAVTMFLGFALVAVTYQLINGLDFVLHQGAPGGDAYRSYQMILAKALSPDSITNGLRFFAFAILQPFFPASINPLFFMEPLYYARIGIEESMWSNVRLSFSTIVSLTALAGTLWVGVAGARNMKRSMPRGAIGMFWLFLAILATYSLLNVTGRMNVRPLPEILSYNAYYAYFPLALLVVCLGCLLPAVVIRAIARPPGRVMIMVLFASFLWLGVSSARKTRDTNTRFAARLAPMRTFLDDISAFVSEHGDEPEFSIAFDVEKLGVITVLGIPIPTIFFREFENNYDPRYVLTRDSTGIVWVPGTRYTHTAQTAEMPIFPDLAEIGNRYQLYAYRGRYLVMLYACGKRYDGFADGAETLDEARQIAKDLVQEVVAWERRYKRSLARPTSGG